MPIGLVISVLLHTALLAWALVTISRAPEDRPSIMEPVAVAIVTPDEVTRLKQGDRNAKNLEAEAKAAPKTEVAKKEMPKPKPPATTEPPPPPPPPPEPAKVEPPPDPIAQKMAALAKEPPPPEPTPGPSPDEQKRLEEKLEQEKRAEEQRKQSEAVKKKAEEERKQKLAEEAKRKAAEEAKRKAAEAKKKQFDPDAIEKALKNLDPKAGGQTAAAEPAKVPTKVKGPTAGAPEGKDNRLTASEMSLLAAQIRQGVQPCWRVLGGGQGADATAVKMRIQFNQDGTLKGEPQIQGGQSSAFFMAAAESAKRAVIQCQPYNLPVAKYDAWKDVILNFDPKDMF